MAYTQHSSPFSKKPKEKLISSTSTKTGDWKSGTNTIKTNTYSSKSTSSKSYEQFKKEGGDVDAAKAFNASKNSLRTETLNYSTSGVANSSIGPTGSTLTTPVDAPKSPPRLIWEKGGVGDTAPPTIETKKYRTPLKLKLKRFFKKVEKKFDFSGGKFHHKSKRRGCAGGNCP